MTEQKGNSKVYKGQIYKYRKERRNNWWTHTTSGRYLVLKHFKCKDSKYEKCTLCSGKEAICITINHIDSNEMFEVTKRCIGSSYLYELAPNEEDGGT